VAEALGDELNQFNVRIFSTDVDPEAIAFARRGRYPPSALDSVPEGIRDRHFTREGDHYEVKKSVRMLTVFGQHDLGQRAPFPRVDLTLCRNVLIYFTTDLQRRALQLFAFSLRDGGYLVLGKAESTTPLPEYFVLEQPRLKIYRRQGERVLIPPARIKDSQSILPIRQVTGQRASTLTGLQPSMGRSSSRAAAADRAESVMMRLPVGVVQVDRRYDIQLINASARRLLEIHGPAIGDDFVHLLQPQIATAVRVQLDAGFRGEATMQEYELPSPSIPEPTVRALRITVEHSQAESDEAESVLVLVVDMTEGLRSRRGLEGALKETRAEHDRVMEQARALQARNGELTTANEALTTANAELRSTNEELLVANEEVQAATEEVETLNEELQATNEELETLNEELQATVEELNTTNEDLEARSAELQHSADELEQARNRLENETRRLQLVLDSLPDAVVAVGADGSVTLTNEVYRSLMADGAPLKDEHGHPLDAAALPISRAARGEEFSMRVIAPDGKPLLAESSVARSNGESVSIVRFRPS
jgi:two-component system CheB/CheR fusion protein